VGAAVQPGAVDPGRGAARGAGVGPGRDAHRAGISAALPLLAAGEPVRRVALRAGYLNASAFVAAFRQETGVTPGGYFGR
jgi:AraC-like DNA-binding protein